MSLQFPPATIEVVESVYDHGNFEGVIRANDKYFMVSGLLAFEDLAPQGEQIRRWDFGDTPLARKLAAIESLYGEATTQEDEAYAFVLGMLRDTEPGGCLFHESAWEFFLDSHELKNDPASHDYFWWRQLFVRVWRDIHRLHNPA